jgi:hypothetical protein
MHRTMQVLRPPQVGDVWFVKLHATQCCTGLDTAEVLELSACTALLRLEKDEFGPERTIRYKIADVDWVEFVRQLPRTVEKPACLMSRLDPTAPPWEHRHRDLPRPTDRNPPPPPTSK